jgi:deoxyribose-phosphate aldolase
MLKNSEILARVDHTLLRPDASPEQVRMLCDEAAANGVASVCVNPCYVGRAAEYLDGRVPVCTVIGFPLGATSAAAKAHEAKIALMAGADEFDMVLNTGLFKARELAAAADDILCVRDAIGADKVLKVIIETCLLTDEEKKSACKLVCESGGDFVKTSTGFGAGGATFEDVKLLAAEIERLGMKGKCKIKASGGIRLREDMVRFIELGADRLGASGAVALLGQS